MNDGARIRGMRGAINNHLIEENASLKAQLQAIKKVAKVFAAKAPLLHEEEPHFGINFEVYENDRDPDFRVSDFRRLAEKLDEVDEAPELEMHDSRRQGVTMDWKRSKELSLKMTDTQAQAMRKLLERWMAELDGCVIAANIKPVYDDTKTLLGKAKDSE